MFYYFTIFKELQMVDLNLSKTNKTNNDDSRVILNYVKTKIICGF